MKFKNGDRVRILPEDDIPEGMATVEGWDEDEEAYLIWPDDLEDFAMVNEDQIELTTHG